ncbi:Rossmann-fold NAD(P)-binding domain-containing protein [Micromonospora aurantiaca (nom. illeg.)]
MDITDPASIRELFTQVGHLDAVIVASGSVPFRPLEDLDRDD